MCGMEALGLLFCFSRNQCSSDNKKIYKINIYRARGTKTERICNALASDATFISSGEVKIPCIPSERLERCFRSGEMGSKFSVSSLSLTLFLHN